MKTMLCGIEFEVRLGDVPVGDGAWSRDEVVGGDYLALARVR